MTYTLAEITRSVAEVCGGAPQGTVTGGTVVTLTDSNFWNAPRDDSYNKGTIWFLTGTMTQKTEIITDMAQSGTTFTFATISAAPAAGNFYAVALPEYPRWILRQSVNNALAQLYSREAEDVTTTTVVDQLDYSLPSGVYNVVKAEVATKTSSPYDYRILTGWKEIGATLSLPEGGEFKQAGYIIRLTYVVPPAELTADTSTIPDMIPRELVKWTAAVHAFRWKAEQTHGDPWYVARLADAEDKAKKLKIRYPIIRSGTVPTLPNWYGDGGKAQDVFGTTVRLS